MDDPELYGNERILIRTANVHVKSISFEAILTNKRIIFINRLKNILSQKEIPLVTVQNVEAGENAIRETLITLTVVTNSRERKQMVLTFSRESGGNRAKERNEWIQLINENITPSFEQVIRTVNPVIDPVENTPLPPQKIRISRSPLPPTPAARYEPVTKPQPVKTNSETPLSWQAPAAAHAPVPTAFHVTLGTYCSKCGAKVPEDSGFCDKCGSRIIVRGALPQVPVAIPTPAATVPTVKEERPIDLEIPSVEPLIERSSVKVSHDYAEEPDPLQEIQPEAAPSAAQSQKKFIPQLFTPKELSQSPRVLNSMPTEKTHSRKKLITIGIVIVIIIAIVAVGVVLLNLGTIESILPAFNSSGSSTNATDLSTAAITTPLINQAASIIKTAPSTQVTVVTTTPMIINQAASIV